MSLPADHRVQRVSVRHSPAERCDWGALRGSSSGSRHKPPPTDGTEERNTRCTASHPEYLIYFIAKQRKAKNRWNYSKAQWNGRTYKQVRNLRQRWCPFLFRSQCCPVGWIKKNDMSRRLTKWHPVAYVRHANVIDLWKWDSLTKNPCPISSSQHESGSERPRVFRGHRSITGDL